MKITKYIFLLATLICSEISAQQMIDPPGTDKFAGEWLSINAGDSIIIRGSVRYFGTSLAKIKTVFFYYRYVKNSMLIRDNLANIANDKLSDYLGSRPYGVNLDSLIIVGDDYIKRKNDEGLLIMNANGNQLTFIRGSELSGGGLRVHLPGQEPLPGYTLPDTIIFNKVVIQPTPGDKKIL